MNGIGEDIIISTPLRTAIGTFGGVLKETPATDLGSTVVKEMLKRSGLDGTKVDQVVVGNVLQAGQGMNPGRQVALKSGLPDHVPGMTINRVCGSGLQAVVLGAQQVALGDSQVVVAGGMENMDMAPMLLPKGRYGYRMGMPRADLLDGMVYDGLWDIFNDVHMGITAENVADSCNISREDSDAYAVRSHQLAARAQQECLFKEQIVQVEIQQRKSTISFDKDEHVRPDSSMESLAKLKPVFRKDGTVTAGNASGINDGAAFMIVTNKQEAEQLGIPQTARLVSYAVAGVDPKVMGLGMIPASKTALERANLAVEDIAVWEVNEAFASVAVAVGRELNIPEERLNPVGGAIALGHPIGASGAVLVVKLLHEMARRGEHYGLATLCIGGGMGIAAVFENLQV